MFSFLFKIIYGVVSLVVALGMGFGYNYAYSKIYTSMEPKRTVSSVESFTLKGKEKYCEYIPLKTVESVCKATLDKINSFKN